MAVIWPWKYGRLHVQAGLEFQLSAASDFHSDGWWGDFSVPSSNRRRKERGAWESLHCMTRSFYIILPSKDYEKAMFCSYHRQFLQDKSEFWEPEQQQFSSWGIKIWNKWGGAFYQKSQIHVCKNAIYQLNCKRNMQWMSCLQEVAVGFGFNFWLVGVQWLINCSYIVT